MKTATRIAITVLILTNMSPARADSFGSGALAFDIEFVTIGNPGNPPDLTGRDPAGQVDRTFRIGKFEISEDVIAKASDLGRLRLSHDRRGANKPATSVSWFDAARFVNWLNTSTGSDPAYKFDSNGNFQLWGPGDTGYDPDNLYRNTRARYFLPNVDEWHKAAYYDPIAGVYYDYPTGSDSVPDGIDFAGDPDFDAVFAGGATNTGPNDVNDAGVLSPYGTGAQGGNVWEWEETAYDLRNDTENESRGIRGGRWNSRHVKMRSEIRVFRGSPNLPDNIVGFRVASTHIPEPSTLLLAAMMLTGNLLVVRTSARS